MDEYKVDLRAENLATLAVVQALLGFVTPQLCGVSVSVDGPTATVYFAVTHLDEELGEDIDDVIVDVEALLWPKVPDVVKKVFIGPAGPDWEGRKHRLVMLTKDPGDSGRPESEEPPSRG